MDVEPVATPEQPGSPPRPVPSENLRHLLAQARAAAKAFERPKEALGWKAALAAAPWPKDGPPAWETDFRSAFAGGLLKRGIAKPAMRPGSATKPPWKDRGQKETELTKGLMRRLLTATESEFAEQDKHADAAGLSWSKWVRRKLSEND